MRVRLLYVLCRHFSGDDNARIDASNHPLPLPLYLKATELAQSDAGVAFGVAYNIGFGLSFLIATFVVFLINVRMHPSLPFVLCSDYNG